MISAFVFLALYVILLLQVFVVVKLDIAGLSGIFFYQKTIRPLHRDIVLDNRLLDALVTLFRIHPQASPIGYLTLARLPQMARALVDLIEA